MKVAHLFFAIAILVGLAVPAQATQTWSSNRNITKIYPSSLGLIFYLDGSELRQTPNTSCPGNRMIIPLSAPNYEVIASSLMLAFGSSFPVSVVFETTTLTACNIVIDRAIVFK